MKHFSAFIGSAIATFGFLLCAVDDTSEFDFLKLGVLLISIALGIWWVTAPMILIQNAGSNSFGPLWGIVVTSNFIGILLFSTLFSIVWDAITKPLVIYYMLALMSCSVS